MEYYGSAEGHPASFGIGGVGLLEQGAGHGGGEEGWRDEREGGGGGSQVGGGGSGGGGGNGGGGPSSESVEHAFFQISLQEGGGSQQHPFPERPGQPDCSFYVRTGTCDYGMSCRFNHPPNRRQTGGPSQRSTSSVSRGGEFPERPGQQDCQFFLKTGTCKFGSTCKFNHPRDKAGSAGRTAMLNIAGLPVRPGEKECAYFMRTGNCKYGATCKFHHPQPISAPGLQAPPGYANTPPSPNPSQIPNMPWAPMNRGPLFQHRLHSPAAYQQMVLHPQAMMPLPTWGFQPLGPPDASQQQLASPNYAFAPSPDASAIVSSYNQFNSGASSGIQSSGGVGGGQQRDTTVPERPGQPECAYYIRTGICKYGMSCKFHHPRERGLPPTTTALNPLGLPFRPGAQACTYYLRFGNCKFGVACKFDHPLRDLNAVSGSLSDMAGGSYPLMSTGPDSAESEDGGGTGGQAEAPAPPPYHDESDLQESQSHYSVNLPPTG